MRRGWSRGESIDRDLHTRERRTSTGNVRRRLAFAYMTAVGSISRWLGQTRAEERNVFSGAPIDDPAAGISHRHRCRHIGIGWSLQ